MTLSDRIARARAALGRHGDRARLWWVPGRIEVLGKHTDYAGGRSLVCAVDYGFVIAAIPRDDRTLHVIDALTGEQANAELSATLVPRVGHWSNYPFTVAHRVAANFPGALRGIDLAFASNLPPAAGLSSSSALVIGTFLALSDANDLSDRAEYRAAITSLEQLAEYLGAVENGRTYRTLVGERGVGTAGGNQDQTAILASHENALIQIRYAPVTQERVVPLPNGLEFVIAASGVPAEKTGAAMAHYNQAAARAFAVLDVWRSVSHEDVPTLGHAVANGPEACARMAAALQDGVHANFSGASLRGRLEQFYNETMNIIPAAAEALAVGDLHAFGALVDASQRGAEQFLDNQVPETIALARDARSLGAVAASAFGAGFGGSVYALVRSSDAPDFQAAWAARYHERFAARAAASRFFRTGAGQPAHGLVEV